MLPRTNGRALIRIVRSKSSASSSRIGLRIGCVQRTDRVRSVEHPRDPTRVVVGAWSGVLSRLVASLPSPGGIHMGRDQHDTVEAARQLGLNVLQQPSLVREAVPAHCEAPRSDPFQILDQRCDGRAIVGMQDVPALDHCPVGRGRLCCRVPFDMAAEVLSLDPRVQDLPLRGSEGNRGRGHPRLGNGMVVELVDQCGGGNELQVVPVLCTAEVVILHRAARWNRDDKAVFRRRQDAPRVGRGLEEVCGIPVERQEAAAQLAVIA